MVFSLNFLMPIFSVLNELSYFISSFLFTLSFTLFYLDDFKLSNTKLFKYIKIFSFLFIPFYIIYQIYIYNVFIISLFDIISYAIENKDISKGMQIAGSQIKN